MIKEPEDEAFEAIEKAQQQRKLLVDKGCAERGCMGYDSRDGDTPVEMSIHRPWVGLTDKEILADDVLRYYFGLNGGAGPVSKSGRKIVDALEVKLRSKNNG